MNDGKKLAFFIPNIFTALNMACGFASIIFSIKGNFYNASMILILGAFFDLVDGRVARLTGTQSSFGEQFDSMSDVISFGMAPSFLVYNRFFVDLGRAGLVVSFIFLLCGALRLARFNANIEKIGADYFQGLPIPGAAFALAGYVLWSLEFDWLTQLSGLTIIYVLFYSFLMISNIPFFSFKDSTWVMAHKKSVLFLIFLILAFTFSYEELMIGVIISLYVIGCLFYFWSHKGELKDVFSWKNESEND